MTVEDRYECLNEAVKLVAQTYAKEPRAVLKPLLSGFVAGLATMALDEAVAPREDRERVLDDIYAAFPGLQVLIERFIRDD